MKKVRMAGAAVLMAVFLCGCNKEMVAVNEATIWQADYNAALKQAATETKYVLIDFSGSDWCGWCIKLEDEVFSQKEFTDYASSNLVCVLVDFPRSKPQTDEQKKKNEDLSRKYNIEGFPTVLILNPQGKAIKRTGYQRGGAGNYVEFIKSVIADDQKK